MTTRHYKLPAPIPYGLRGGVCKTITVFRFPDGLARIRLTGMPNQVHDEARAGPFDDAQRFATELSRFLDFDLRIIDRP